MEGDFLSIDTFDQLQKAREICSKDKNISKLDFMRKNNSDKKTFRLLFDLWINFSKKRKRQFLFLMILNIIGSFSESFSIAMTLPLITALVDPNRVLAIEWLRNLFLLIGINTEGRIIIPITIIFISLSILSTTLKLSILWINNYFSALIGNDISCLAYKKTLNQPYEKHIDLNSSQVISAATTYVDFTVRSIYNFLNLLSYLLFIFFIIITLLFINWNITIFSLLLFGSIYLIILIKSKFKLVNNGKIIAYMTKRIKSIQEGLGSIRDMILLNMQNAFEIKYANYDLIYRKKLAFNKFLRFAPRYIIENIGFIFIAVLAYFSSTKVGSNQNELSIIGTFAVAAQKLLPSMQQCYNSMSALRSNKGSIIEILKILDQKYFEFDYKNLGPFNFKDKLVLSNISFKYKSSDKDILKDINITIKKGERIGIVGKTGSGKSTLCDIMMGLLKPTEGNLIADGKEIYKRNQPQKLFQWRLAISHVPQNIFLSDNSIAENIAFGISLKDIDMKRVIEAAETAQIADFIEASKLKYGTLIGENGIKLSGGQRQRIGIARALYQNSQIIVFDEATSALDNETENNFIKSLETLNSDLTIIMIAHRLSTIESCDKLFEVKDSKIKEI